MTSRHLRYAAIWKNQTQSSSFGKPLPSSLRFHLLYLYKKFVFGHTQNRVLTVYLEWGQRTSREREYHSSPGGVICVEWAGEKFRNRKVPLKSMITLETFDEVQECINIQLKVSRTQISSSTILLAESGVSRTRLIVDIQWFHAATPIRPYLTFYRL